MSINPGVETGAIAADAGVHEPDFFKVRVVGKEAVAQGIYLFEHRHHPHRRTLALHLIGD